MYICVAFQDERINRLLVTFYIFLCFYFLQSNAYNFDVRSAVIKNGAKKSMFGYSVALYRFNRERHLLIGAPLANGSMNVSDAGAIFKCNIEPKGGCSMLDLDKRGEEVLNSTRTESKQRQWLGATLVTSRNGVLLACAPRYVHFSENVRRREPVGLCYLSTLSMHTDSFEYSPCRQPDSWGYHRLGSCQAGFSAALTRDGSHFAIASPGAHYWQGEIFTYARNDTAHIPSSSGERMPSDDDTYLGYSMLLIRFSSKSSSKNMEDIVIGEPRAGLTGRVQVRNFNFELLYMLEGQQAGEYFGYSLAALDVNGDGFTDLVIGAPMHSTYEASFPAFEHGKAYVYLQNVSLQFTLQTLLQSETCNARFGSSLVRIGDANHDGFEDLAVGAPFDGPDSIGLVYIFNGASTGLLAKPSQIISPLHFSHLSGAEKLRTFGFSLASGMDLNHDDYPDLLVGAPASDTVVFFKTRPLLDMKVKFDVHPKNVSIERKTCAKIDGTQVPCVTVTVCLAYGGSRSLPARLRFLWSVTLDAANEGKLPPRMYVVNMNQDRLQVSRGALTLERGKYGHCSKFKAYVQEYAMDSRMPIEMKLDFVIQNYHSLPTSSRLHTPMIDPTQFISRKLLVYAQRDCGEDGRCLPDLQVDVTKNMDSYTLNAPANLKLNISIRNAGEHAYQAMLRIDLPVDVTLVNIHWPPEQPSLPYQQFSAEMTGDNRLQIELGDPMESFSQTYFTLEFATHERLRTTYPDLTFIVNVSSLNEEDPQTLHDNMLVIGIPVRVNLNIQTYGQSFVNNQAEEYICNSDEVTNEDEQDRHLIFPDRQPLVKHVYYIRNRGPSALQQANFTIYWPERTVEQRSLFELIAQPNIRVINQPERLARWSWSKQKLKNKILEDQSPISVACEHVDLQAIITQDLPQTEYVRSWDEENLNIKTARIKRRIKRKYVIEQPAPAFITFSCDPSRCRRIECWISDMAANTEVIIELLARPWNSTLREVHITRFPVTSVAVLQISNNKQPMPILPSTLSSPIVIRVSTLVLLAGNSSTLDPVPLRAIMMAICVSLSILTLIVLLLEKLDFFKREKIKKGSFSALSFLLQDAQSSIEPGNSLDHCCDNCSTHSRCNDFSEEFIEASAEISNQDTEDEIGDARSLFEASSEHSSQSSNRGKEKKKLFIHYRSDQTLDANQCRVNKLNLRHVYNEKRYEKLHYIRNYAHYAFYTDLAEHEPNCPFYASKRSLVSYK